MDEQSVITFKDNKFFGIRDSLLSCLSKFAKRNDMKTFFVCLASMLFFSGTFGQKTETISKTPDSNKKLFVAEAACGECQFKMKGDDCDLAVRINGKTYFVDGTKIDDHGDAHAKDGFCNAVRKAEVQGEIVGNRFKATYFKLLKEEKKNEVPKQN
jgi:hypothetical protein